MTPKCQQLRKTGWACDHGDTGLGRTCKLRSHLLQIIEKTLVFKEAGLGKSMHTFAYFNKNISILVGKPIKIVFFDDNFRDVADMYTHVIEDFHGCLEVEIFYVSYHEGSTWS